MTLAVPSVGRLSETPLPKLLRALQHAQATGALTVTRNDQTKLIYFKHGDIIFASSRYEDERLGEMLLKWGQITFAQYEESVRLMKETKKQQGTILVEQGILTPKELFQAVSVQVKEIIFSLFTWLDGNYRFVTQTKPGDEVITLRMSSGALIYEGIRRINDFSRLCRLLPPLDTVVNMSTEPRDLFQTVAVRPDEQQLLLLIDGTRTIRQLVYASTLPSIRAFQMIYFLLSTAIIQVNTQEAPGEHTVVFRKNIKSELEAIIREVINQREQEDLELSRVDLFELPRKERLVTGPEAVMRAYKTLEDKDDYQMLGVGPDASAMEIKKAYFRLAKAYHPDRHHEPGMEALQEVLEVLFDRLTQAYSVLSHTQTRRQYDESRSMPSQPPPVQAKPDESPQQTRQEEVDQGKRGEAALLAGNLNEAIACFESAIRQDNSNARAHALLGQALINVPSRRGEAEAEIQRALELDPSNADYYVFLGQLYLKLRSMGRAIMQFEEALRLDPVNAKAKAQVERLTKGVFD